jgi:hypothetical protein
MPVVDRRLGERLQALAPESVQLVQVDANGRDKVLFNVLSCIDAIDSARTVGERWTEKDGRPDKVGQYRTIVHLAVDAVRVGAVDTFRLAGWRSPLIISERLADALTDAEVEGVVLMRVA